VGELQRLKTEGGERSAPAFTLTLTTGRSPLSPQSGLKYAYSLFFVKTIY